MKRAVLPFVADDLTIRPLAEVDLSATLAWRNHADVRRWFKSDAIIEPDSHRRWFESYLVRDNDFIFVACRDGTPVAQGSVYAIDWAAREAEVGRFIVDPMRQGQGLMRRFGAALVRFCWGDLDLRRLRLEVFEINVRAIAVYGGLGFRQRGHSKQGLLEMVLERSDD